MFIFYLYDVRFCLITSPLIHMHLLHLRCAYHPAPSLVPSIPLLGVILSKHHSWIWHSTWHQGNGSFQSSDTLLALINQRVMLPLWRQRLKLFIFFTPQLFSVTARCMLIAASCIMQNTLAKSHIIFQLFVLYLTFFPCMFTLVRSSETRGEVGIAVWWEAESWITSNGCGWVEQRTVLWMKSCIFLSADLKVSLRGL